MSKQMAQSLEEQQDQEQIRFHELLRAAGFMPKTEVELLTPETRVAKLVELEELLTLAKAQKNLAVAKRIRSKMRKLGFYRSKHMKVEVTL